MLLRLPRQMSDQVLRLLVFQVSSSAREASLFQAFCKIAGGSLRRPLSKQFHRRVGGREFMSQK